ncbi:MAG: hypothetical protein EA418_02060 [Wenzhouxiangellaceae bacterium]|nr:MAG: hypothetical protein EA418_02060 [Wenzhouxiangellaceae bacterium]
MTPLVCREIRSDFAAARILVVIGFGPACRVLDKGCSYQFAGLLHLGEIVPSTHSRVLFQASASA